LGGAEEQHRLLMECVTDYAIFYLDPNGHVATWNAGAERIFGYPEAAIVGQHFSCFFTAEDVAKGVPQKELQTAATAGRANDDRWLVGKGGARLWCNGVTTALRDEDGRLRGFAKVLRERTEPKRLQEALHQRAVELAEEARQKDDFLAVLAHESLWAGIAGRGASRRRPGWSAGRLETRVVAEQLADSPDPRPRQAARHRRLPNGRVALPLPHGTGCG
jgi:PAS domain S-box-containing protein